MRIVSLLPSSTEILCALGLENQLVGVTHECDFPESIRGLPKVTRTSIPSDATSAEIDRLVSQQLKASDALYNLDFAVLESLRPDVIVTQSLCDVCVVADREVQAAFCKLSNKPVIVNLEPQSSSDVFDAIETVAGVTGQQERGRQVVTNLKARVQAVVVKANRLENRPRMTLLEWLDPPFSSGHWNPELVRLAGGIEGLGQEGKRSQRLSWDNISAWDPEIILIACCGFGIERTLQDISQLESNRVWQELSAVQANRVFVTDGSSYFNRPGPRLVDSLEILSDVIHLSLGSTSTELQHANSVINLPMRFSPINA